VVDDPPFAVRPPQAGRAAGDAARTCRGSAPLGGQQERW